MLKEITNHRSIRNYSSKEIPEQILDEVLLAGTRASTVGNMQLYSMIVTTNKQIKEQLAPCHFNQPMVMQAPVVITFCADINRFSLWCKQRDAVPEYDNFIWFVNGVIDTVLASENVVIEAEAQGLGICYLGTTLYTAKKIAEILELPSGVIPVTTITLGYPNEDASHPMTDRLPLEAVVHKEKYQNYSAEQIDELWSEKENLEQTAQLLKENDLPNLARIFTERRYKGEDNKLFSKIYFDELKAQGFFNQ